MFEFTCRLDAIPMAYVVKDIYTYAKKVGYIDKKEFISRLAPHIKVEPGDDKIGWLYEQIVGMEKRAKIDEQTGYTIFSLDDPLKFIELTGFDPVSSPSHYTKGRKYEPRKVIHDWNLNFNLGNAVKYIARAGRKGDTIEDLRKAIQYIEFEIEELE